MTQYDLGGLMGGMSAQQAVEKAKEDSLLPAGDYVMALTDIQVNHKQRPNAPAGVLNVQLQLTFTVQEGQYTGRTVRAFVAVDHHSQDFVRMSRKMAGELALACGHSGNVNSLDMFKNRPVVAKVTVSKPKGDYGPNNNIGDIKPLGVGGAPRMPAGPAGVTPFQPPAAAPPQQQYAPPPPAAQYQQPQQPQAQYTPPAQPQQAYAPPPPAGPALNGGGVPPWKAAG